MAQGFEKLPEGRLLEQIVDLAPEMGLAYERSIGFYKAMHAHVRDMLVFPRGACRMEVKTKAGESFVISSAHVLFVPQSLVHDDRAASAVYDTIALYPSETYMRQLGAENGLDEADVRALRHGGCRKLKRTRWLDDLIERYFFERVINRNSPPGCPFFLEKQILNELARLVFSTKLATHGAVLGDEPVELAEAARRYVEAHLFEEWTLADVAKHLKCNESTLARAFKRSFGTSPGAYAKERRLDEAASLIERGEYRIGDVALLVGYEDLSAFARAFKARFKVAPGSYRKG